MSAQLSEFTACLIKKFNYFDGIIQPPNPRPKRCLFGRPDPEQLSQDLDKQEKIFYEEDARRFRELWSFDPVTGPLEDGKFQYEVIAVDSSDDIPNFYKKSYTCNKSKHARVGRGVSFSAKRKLDLDNEENDENEVVDKRVPSEGDVVNDDVREFNDNSCSGLCGVPGGLTLSSPVSSHLMRNKDIMTPPPRPGSLVQSSIKDYLPNKKQRMHNTKALPRT